jgi:hypothetical protein
LIIATKFMVDHCPFLLEALTWVDNNTFFFQQHFKVACDLLSPPIRTYLLPFEQFIKEQMVQFQYSISKHLHHHTLPTCSSIRYMRPIVLEFYHVLAQGRTHGLQLD